MIFKWAWELWKSSLSSSMEFEEYVYLVVGDVDVGSEVELVSALVHDVVVRQGLQLPPRQGDRRRRGVNNLGEQNINNLLLGMSICSIL